MRLSFVTFRLQHERVVAGMASNTDGAIPAVERLVRSRVQVRREELADPDVPLAAVGIPRGARTSRSPGD